MENFDISVVITAHHEGLIAVSSLRSAQIAIEKARAVGLKVEAIAMLDNPDEMTVTVFDDAQKHLPGISIHHVSFGDAGFSRNAAAQLARGKYIALLDADDMWISDWLVKAHEAAENDAREIVWHPETNVYWGDPLRTHLFIHMDMEDPAFRIGTLAFTNCWTSLSFAKADLFRRVPYTGSDLKGGIGYEDWTWNIDVLEAGAIHKIVRDMAHTIRMKKISLLKSTNEYACIRRPTGVFRRMIAERARADEKAGTN